MSRSGWIPGTVLALLLVSATTVLAGGDPHYAGYEARWDDLVAKYAATSPAVMLEHTIRVDVLKPSMGPWKTRTTETMVMAVFDLKKAKDELDQTFTVAPGVKVKTLESWSHELGAKEVTWSEAKDVYEIKTFGPWKEKRISIPGLSSQGVCGVTFETQQEGFAMEGGNFAGNLPLVKGELDYHGPSLGYFNILMRGPVDTVDAAHLPAGVSWAWRVSDLPARPHVPLALAPDLPTAEVWLLWPGRTWAAWVEAYTDVLDGLAPPEDMVAAARDTLAGRPPEEIVEAVARALGDPSRFRVYDDGRTGSFAFGDLDEVVRSREGTSFQKLLLAHVILDGLGVENHLAFAASRYRTILDWRIVAPGVLDAALLWIPAVSDGFVWDVGSREAAWGHPGPDLYPEMFVVDPDRPDPFKTFSVDMGRVQEDRTTIWTVSAGGSMSGTVDDRFGSWPTESGLDPWRKGQDLEAMLEAECPYGTEVHDVAWTARNPDLPRCTPEAPAVLSGRVEAEALPRGAHAWEVRPLIWPLPAFLVHAAAKDRKIPVSLDRRVEIADSAVVRLDGLKLVRAPRTSRVQNDAGALECRWEEKDGEVIVHRKLWLPAGRLTGSGIADLVALVKAWNDSRSLGVVVQ